MEQQMDNILKTAYTTIKTTKICDNCLGRRFAKVLHGTDNRTRGYVIKTLLAMEAHLNYLKTGDTEMLEKLATNAMSKIAVETLRKIGKEVEVGEDGCDVCQGLFDRIDYYVDKILALEELREYEFSTFLVGSRHPQLLFETTTKEKIFGVDTAEPLKTEFNREVGKKLSAKIGKKVSLESPDIVILVDTGIDSVSIEVRPLFIRGRYRKLVRGIPQTHWPCPRCHGKGCDKCGNTGKMYSESVEELIVPPILEHSRGEKAVFHGAGREDIDARMLGSGRPFIVEIKNPRRRFLDFDLLRRDINNFARGKVEVVNLAYSHRGEVVELKEKTGVKRYNATVQLDREVTPEDIGKVEGLVGVVEQRTPRRVLHRRADRVRRRSVYRVEVVSAGENELRLMVECDGGLYVKEFITGDGGRTTPSVAETLGTQARCVELDVIHVNMGDEKGG